ncbi:MULTISPECIES: N-acetylmuramoyl-L-alanine amidase family protein [Clostridium]|uniref:N-acetylmuramoyl-L-alanine amidase family protein n=1 Tax=Clostridium TaxID=1485 RepID=UPI0038B342CD
MSKLCFDYGHGGEDGGASYNGRKESNDVLSLGRAVATEVRRNGVIVHEIRTTDVTVSLTNRSNFENENTYDYFISFHRNAFQPEKAKGVEIYTYLNGGAKAKTLAQRIQTSLVALGFINRGVKEANFHVLRETKSPAVLVEIGFIDNTGDNNLFNSKRSEIIKAISKAILSVVDIK